MKITSNAFSKLKRIESIHLDKNKLTYVPKLNLKGLKKLKSLTFADNKIKKITKPVLVSKSLKILSLARNRVKSISKGSFKSLPKLKLLILASNPMKKMTRENLGVKEDTQLKYGGR